MSLSHIQGFLKTAEENLILLQKDSHTLAQIDAFVDLLETTFRNGNKVYSAGNGGSHCDAMHFAEEWTGRYRKDRKPLPALALSDPSHLSCVSNDYGFEHVFERMVDAFGVKGDVFVGITTSGNSPNILLAAETAKKKGMKVVGLLGKDGGKMKPLCDIPIVVPGATTDRIQELHIKVIHIAIECTERRLFPELYND
ncbi:MAG: D-sedoheptulose 7-phosphate isomerase [Bacteroidetes bacterium]|nr:D-sedoheptulose 7-phosphate isomerase [Bacteroidota bacterium]